MRRFRSILAALLALCCSPARAEPVAIPLHTLPVGGRVRSYTLERFRADQPHGLLPILIYLHGVNDVVSEPTPPRFDLPFATVPGMEPALIVRPQGVNGRWNSAPVRTATWRQRLLQAVDLADPPPDDVAFLRALIAHLVEQEGGDPARVYVAGVSAGGFMAARVACELGDVVTAVADVIGTARSAQLQRCGSPRPVPFLLLASTTDPRVPYAGWNGGDPAGAASAPDTAAFFARHNGCTAQEEHMLPHLDPDVDSTVSLIRYSGCRDGADVLFYRVDGAGHSVPSMAPPEPGGWAANGARNRDMDTAQAVWDFFRDRRLAPSGLTH